MQNGKSISDYDLQIEGEEDFFIRKDCKYNRITDFYIEKNKIGNCILTFNEMVEQIIVDYHEKIDTVAYQYFQVLRRIRDAYAEYPKETWNHCTESNCKDCNSSNACNVFKQISILNERTEIEKNQIIHNFLYIIAS